MFCPLRNTWKLVCKENCLHKGGSIEECRFKENAALADLPEKQKVQAISDLHDVSKQEIMEAVHRIRLVVVADAFVEYTTGRSMLDQKGGALTLDKASFESWNKTDFTYDEVSGLVSEISNQLKGVIHENSQSA